MNFRPLRDDEQEIKLFKRLTCFASFFAAIALAAISIVNALCPFLFGNSETILLLAFAAAAPIVLAWRNPHRETGIELYGTLVLLLLLSNLGLLFMDGYRDEFYSTVFLVLVIPFVLFVLDKIASMYVHWVTASPMMDRAAMVFLRGVWKERFGRGLFVPAKISHKNRLGPADSINESLRRIANYPAFLLSVFLICFASIVCAQLFASSLIAQTGLIVASVLVAATAFWIASKNEGVVDTVFSAMLLFCNAMSTRFFPGTIQYPNKYRRRLNLFYSAIMMLSFSVNTFWFPWALGSFFQVGSASQLVLNIGIQFIVVVALAPLLMFAMAVISIGPTLREFHRLCEGGKALLGHEGWSEFDCLHDRLSKSSNADEAECVWVGFHEQKQFPILIPMTLFNQHAHLLGGSGAGKTGLGLATLTAQMIRQNDGPVIVIDGKGDNEFFQSILRWCEEDKRKFKWFTTSAEKSTYLFNPLGQKAIEKFSLSEIVGFFLLSLNLFHGSDYGRGWYTQASKKALAEATKLKREGESKPATLEIFCKHLEAIVAGEKELEKAAKHVLYLIQTLAEFPQLNNASLHSPPNSDVPRHPACEHAIDMLEVIKKKQVVYFSFDSLTDVSSAGELSRMAVYSIISAAKAFHEETATKPQVTVIIDEAQNIVASNIGSAIEMARSRGIHFVFSHQSRDQLKLGGGTDLRSIFDACTQVKLHFDAVGETVNHLQAISGEVGYADGTWEQFVSDLTGGNASKAYALKRGGNPAIASVRMEVGPRLSINEIQDSASKKNGCILAVNRREGLAQYKGAFPIHVDYPITEEDYKAHQLRRWPARTDETVESVPHWPNIPNETVVRSETERPKSDDEIVSELLKAANGETN